MASWECFVGGSSNNSATAENCTFILQVTTYAGGPLIVILLVLVAVLSTILCCVYRKLRSTKTRLRDALQLHEVEENDYHSGEESAMQGDGYPVEDSFESIDFIEDGEKLEGTEQKTQYDLITLERMAAADNKATQAEQHQYSDVKEKKKKKKKNPPIPSKKKDSAKSNNEEKSDGYNTLFCTPDLALQVGEDESSYSILDNTKNEAKSEVACGKVKELPPTPIVSKVKDLPAVPSLAKASSRGANIMEMVVLPKVKPYEDPKIEPATEVATQGDSVYYNESVLISASKANECKKESVSGIIPKADAYEDIPRFHEESKKETPDLPEGVYYNNEAVVTAAIAAELASGDQIRSRGEKRVDIYTQSISLDTF